jgi:hypothetical protein
MSDATGVVLLATVPLAVGVAELGLRLPFAEQRRKIQVTLSKSLRTMRAPAVSDHWKQRALLFYSGITFRATLNLLGYVAVLAAATGLGVLSIGLVIPNFDAVTLSVTGMVPIVLTVTLYLLLRLRPRHG